jgi:hypothetical protein
MRLSHLKLEEISNRRKILTPTSRKRAKSDIVEVLEEIDRNKRKMHEEKIEQKDKMFKWFRERFSQ